MRISDCSSDVCSSDLVGVQHRRLVPHTAPAVHPTCGSSHAPPTCAVSASALQEVIPRERGDLQVRGVVPTRPRSEEHTSELQSLMRISYAVFCLKNKIYT